MLNVYDYIANSRFYKTYKVDDLLFVEYKCMYGDHSIPYWTHNNYFSYILSGQSRYVSGDKEYTVHAGDALFIKRGSYIAHGHGKGDYCALFIFVSDEFIKTVLNKYPTPSPSKNRIGDEGHDSIFPLNIDQSLTSYFHSLLSYFSKDISPMPELLKIKFEELLLNLMTCPHHQSLARCLRGIQERGKISIRSVMETSFMFNMSLEEYARLCARSLSAFKAEFFDIYHTTPGKWLIRARTQFAKLLIESTDDSINDIAFKSGFKNTAHFVKVFKDFYGMPPLQYRLHKATVADVMAVS
jgi:AraC-like DNA-binding protein